MRTFWIAAPLGALGLALGAAALAQPPAGPAVEGHRLYMSDGCYECHGTSGEGGGATPKLAPDPAPIELFMLQLRHPARRMPAYSEQVLSDAQIGEIHAYLQTIPPGKPASAIPLLSR